MLDYVNLCYMKLNHRNTNTSSTRSVLKCTGSPMNAVPEGSLRPVPHRCCRPSNLRERQQAAKNVNKPTPRADLAGCQQMPTNANWKSAGHI